MIDSMAHIFNISTHLKFHSQLLSSLHQPILKRDGPSELVSPPRFLRSPVMGYSLLGTLKVHRCRCHCRYSSKSWFPCWEPQLFFRAKMAKTAWKKGGKPMWKAHKNDVREAIAIGLHMWKNMWFLIMCSQNSDQNKNTYATPQKIAPTVADCDCMSRWRGSKPMKSHHGSAGSHLIQPLEAFDVYTAIFVSNLYLHISIYMFDPNSIYNIYSVNIYKHQI